MCSWDTDPVGLQCYKEVTTDCARAQGLRSDRYPRGTNCCEAVNLVVEAAFPKKCGPDLARAAYQFCITRYNLRTGVKCYGWTDAGCTDLPLLRKGKLCSLQFQSLFMSSVSTLVLNPLPRLMLYAAACAIKYEFACWCGWASKFPAIVIVASNRNQLCRALVSAVAPFSLQVLPQV